MHGRPTSTAAVHRRTVSKGRRPPQASRTPDGGPHRQQMAAGTFSEASFVKVGTGALRPLEDAVDVEQRLDADAADQGDDDAQAARELLVALDARRQGPGRDPL